MMETSKATISLGVVDLTATYNAKLGLKVWPPEGMRRIMRKFRKRQAAASRLVLRGSRRRDRRSVIGSRRPAEGRGRVGAGSMRESRPENSVRFSRDTSESCHNPLCKATLPERVRRPRYFCSDRCKDETSVLRRAARLLTRLGQGKAWEILTELNGGERDG